jgi:hypothetical protein
LALSEKGVEATLSIASTSAVESVAQIAKGVFTVCVLSGGGARSLAERPVNGDVERVSLTAMPFILTEH